MDRNHWTPEDLNALVEYMAQFWPRYACRITRRCFFSKPSGEWARPYDDPSAAAEGACLDGNVLRREQPSSSGKARRPPSCVPPLVILPHENIHASAASSSASTARSSPAHLRECPAPPSTVSVSNESQQRVTATSHFLIHCDS